MSIFGDLLIKLDFVQEAFARKQALDKITNLSEQIGKHFLKIILFKYDNSYRGHIRSLEGWLRDCEIVFNKSKTPISKDALFEALFKTPWQLKLDQYKRVLNVTFKDYTVPMTKIYDDCELSYRLLRKFFEKVTDIIYYDKSYDLEKLIKDLVEE